MSNQLSCSVFMINIAFGSIFTKKKLLTRGTLTRCWIAKHSESWATPQFVFRLPDRLLLSASLNHARCLHVLAQEENSYGVHLSVGSASLYSFHGLSHFQTCKASGYIPVVCSLLCGQTGGLKCCSVTRRRKAGNLPESCLETFQMRGLFFRVLHLLERLP